MLLDETDNAFAVIPFLPRVNATYRSFSNSFTIRNNADNPSHVLSLQES